MRPAGESRDKRMGTAHESATPVALAPVTALAVARWAPCQTMRVVPPAAVTVEAELLSTTSSPVTECSCISQLPLNDGRMEAVTAHLVGGIYCRRRGCKASRRLGQECAEVFSEWTRLSSLQGQGANEGFRLNPLSSPLSSASRADHNVGTHCRFAKDSLRRRPPRSHWAEPHCVAAPVGSTHTSRVPRWAEKFTESARAAVATQWPKAPRAKRQQALQHGVCPAARAGP